MSIKAIATLSFDTHQCRETLLTFPCTGKYQNCGIDFCAKLGYVEDMFSQKLIAEHSLCIVFADSSDWISMISCSSVPTGRRDGLMGNGFVMYAQQFMAKKLCNNSVLSCFRW